MSWDPVWDRVFAAGHWGRYPPEELVRFMAGHFGSAPDRRQVKVLEVGCGPGANLWYFSREGFDVFGLDGSPVALRMAEQRLTREGMRAKLTQGDICDLGASYSAGSFDAIVDVCCLQSNRWGSIEKAVCGMARALKPGGRCFSMMVARGSWGDGLGACLEPGTYTDISEGPCRDAGTIHFSSLEEVSQLWSAVGETEIEYSERSLESRSHAYRHWVIAARKSA